LPDGSRERRFHFDPVWNPGRQVLIHPCPDSTFRIDWQVPGDYDLAAEQASGRAGTADPGDHRRDAVRDRVAVGCTGSTPGWWTGCGSAGLLVAGDCAHLVSPFGARGLNSGVGARRTPPGNSPSC